MQGRSITDYTNWLKSKLEQIYEVFFSPLTFPRVYIGWEWRERAAIVPRGKHCLHWTELLTSGVWNFNKQKTFKKSSKNIILVATRKTRQQSHVGNNPSQEGYNNSINSLVEGVPHMFTGLQLGGPTQAQASHIQGPPALATPLSM